MRYKTVKAKVIDNVATGEVLRGYRIGYGLSLQELARRAKISAPYLSDLERGRRNWNENLWGKLNGILADEGIEQNRKKK